MALIDVQLPNSLARALRLPKKSPRRQQLKVLKKLLRKPASLNSDNNIILTGSY